MTKVTTNTETETAPVKTTTTITGETAKVTAETLGYAEKI